MEAFFDNRMEALKDSKIFIRSGKCIIWSSIQVLPNQVSKKSFSTFEDIDLRESHSKLHKKPSETLGAD